MTDKGHGQIDYFKPTYKDINVGAFLLPGPAANLPDEDEFKDSGGVDTGITTYAFAPTEYVDGIFELQHDYMEGTDLTFHVHWQGITAPGGGTDNVQFQLIYTLGRSGVVLASATTITVEVAVTTQYAFNISSFAAITGTTFLIGDQFLFNFGRIAASADEYAGDALVATVGIHYQVDTLGSAQIASK